MSALLLTAALALGGVSLAAAQREDPPAAPASSSQPYPEQDNRDIEEQLADFVAGFQCDPYGFVRACFPWGEGELEKQDGPYDWQRDVLVRTGEKLRAGAAVQDAMRDAVQEAVVSGHGVGKSAIVSWLILWALSTFEDTRGVVTANTDTQLRTKTWPEVQKWHRLCLTSHWFHYTATALYSVDEAHEKTWRVDLVPWSITNTEAFAGLHNAGKRILVIFDEASAIADEIWEVTEGALTDKGTEILWFAFGNPTRATGRFRECFRRFKHRWHGTHVDARKVPGTNRAQHEKWVQDHGEDSDFVKIRVRGIFPSASPKQFISEADVDAAYGKHLRRNQYDWAPKIISVEPAWEGDDELVIAMRQGLLFQILATMPKNDNDVHVANRVARFEDEHEADAVFVDGGYGTGIVSVGRTNKRNWQIVWFSGKSGDPGCLNKRAEMWKLTRDWLKAGGAIPEDEVLRLDLTGPETVARVDGKIQLESKDDMKDRNVPSPNRGDALALTFAFPVKQKDPPDALGRRSRGARVQTKYNPLKRGGG